jgi:hypothetical protein
VRGAAALVRAGSAMSRKTHSQYTLKGRDSVAFRGLFGKGLTHHLMGAKIVCIY